MVHTNKLCNTNRNESTSLRNLHYTFVSLCCPKLCTHEYFICPLQTTLIMVGYVRNYITFSCLGEITLFSLQIVQWGIFSCKCTIDRPNNVPHLYSDQAKSLIRILWRLEPANIHMGAKRDGGLPKTSLEENIILQRK